MQHSYYQSLLKKKVAYPISFDLDPRYGVTVENGKVTAITEQGTSGYTGTQATDAARPLYVENAYNGHPCLRHAGAQFLSFGDVWDFNSASRTIFVVAKATPATAEPMYYFAKSQGNNTQNRFGFGWNSTGVVYGLFHAEAGGPATTLDSPRYDTNLNVLAMKVTNGAAANLMTYKNGAPGDYNGTGIVAVNQPNYNTNSANRLLVGAYNSGTDTGQTLFYKGDILRILGYDHSFSAAEVVTETNRLKTLYGI